MNFFRRKNPKPKDPNEELAESIVKTVLDCHNYHIDNARIIQIITGYLNGLEFAIRNSQPTFLCDPLPHLRQAHNERYNQPQPEKKP